MGIRMGPWLFRAGCRGLHVTEERFGRVPRAYVTTGLDRAVSPARQQRFLAVRPCDPVVSMETGHTPFAAAPDALAAHLAALAAHQ